MVEINNVFERIGHIAKKRKLTLEESINHPTLLKLLARIPQNATVVVTESDVHYGDNLEEVRRNIERKFSPTEEGVTYFTGQHSAYESPVSRVHIIRASQALPPGDYKHAHIRMRYEEPMPKRN